MGGGEWDERSTISLFCIEAEALRGCHQPKSVPASPVTGLGKRRDRALKLFTPGSSSQPVMGAERKAKLLLAQVLRNK